MPNEKKITGKKKKADYPIHHLKIVLKEIRPLVWRRILMAGDGDMSLRKLHKAVQILMGWEDYHLQQFTAGGSRFGIPDREGFWDTDEKDDRRFRLAEIAPVAGSRMKYVYDFGDNWELDILVEKRLPPDKDFKSPLCLAGKRAGPPDDCSGA